MHLSVGEKEPLNIILGLVGGLGHLLKIVISYLSKLLKNICLKYWIWHLQRIVKQIFKGFLERLKNICWRSWTVATNIKQIWKYWQIFVLDTCKAQTFITEPEMNQIWTTESKVFADLYHEVGDEFDHQPHIDVMNTPIFFEDLLLYNIATDWKGHLL